MKMDTKKAVVEPRKVMKPTFLVGCACLAGVLSSCSLVSQVANPTEPKGFIATTGGLSIDRSDCRVLSAQAIGESKGFSLLGIIPIKQPSEIQAVKSMYDSVARRGVQIDGQSAYFANRAVERSTNYYILWSRPTIKASGDLVQYLPGAKSQPVQQYDKSQSGR